MLYNNKMNLKINIDKNIIKKLMKKFIFKNNKKYIFKKAINIKALVKRIRNFLKSRLFPLTLFDIL